jgi:hypothetical protein
MGAYWYWYYGKLVARWPMYCTGVALALSISVHLQCKSSATLRLYSEHSETIHKDWHQFRRHPVEACKEIKESLSQSTIINQKLKTGDLKVLSIYMGTDEKNWRSHLGVYPKQWLQGITDGSLHNKKIYDLSAIPTMYLLNKDKNVLLKDYFTVQLIEQLVK